MKLSDLGLKLRCYVKKDGDVWVASCLDLCLAAQGNSLPEAKEKLKAMIEDYIYEALAGDDREYIDQLIPRRAPWQEWVKYYYYMLLNKCNNTINTMHQTFKIPFPWYLNFR